MAEASFHRIRDWIDLNEVMSRLLVLHGGSHAFAASHLTKALIAGSVAAKLRYLDQFAPYPQIERESVLWAGFWRGEGRIRWQAEISAKGRVVTDDPSEYPPDYRWQVVVISTLDLGGYAHQVLFNRRDCDQHLFAESPTVVPEEPEPPEPRKPVPLAPKEWLSGAVARLRQAHDCPERITDAARRLESEMGAAVQAGECTKRVRIGRIKNLLRELNLWS